MSQQSLHKVKLCNHQISDILDMTKVVMFDHDAQSPIW